MKDELFMTQIKRLDTKIDSLDSKFETKMDKLADAISNLTTEIRVTNQKNNDDHKNFDNRICKVEDYQGKKVSAFNNLLGPTFQSKLVNIIIMLIIIIGTLVGANLGGLL